MVLFFLSAFLLSYEINTISVYPIYTPKFFVSYTVLRIFLSSFGFFLGIQVISFISFFFWNDGSNLLNE